MTSQVGPLTDGSVPVSVSATIAAGSAPVVGQTVAFDVGGGCTPAVATGRTDDSGNATVSFSCAVSPATVTVMVSGDGVETISGFVAD